MHPTSKRVTHLLAAFAAAALLGGAGGASAEEWFLKLDGIPGESTDAKHKGEIEILSWSWGASNTSAATRGGARAGKACVQDIVFVKRVDKATPLLLANTVTGMAIPKGTLVGRKSGEKQQEYFKIELKDILISSYSGAATSGDAAPVDQFSVVFGDMQVEYRGQDPKGGLGDVTQASVRGGGC